MLKLQVPGFDDWHEKFLAYEAKMRTGNAQWVCDQNVKIADIPHLREVVQTWPGLNIETTEPGILGVPTAMPGYALVTFYGAQYRGRLGLIWDELKALKARKGIL
jgi:hypothetical protein